MSTEPLEAIDKQIQFIDDNRQQRNHKFHACLESFKTHLQKETAQLQSTENENARRLTLVSGAMENSFSRVLQASDVTIRKIKQTFNEKKQFWDNVIKMNADMANIELKKEFYVQLRNSEDSYYAAIDHQKDKHKPYRALIEQPSQTHPLREYQATNLAFEQQVNQTVQQQWASGKTSKPSSRPFTYSNNEESLLNQFVHRSAEGELLRGQQGDASTLFLNNFQRRK